MTSLILIGALSQSTTGYSQEYWSVYVPLHTTHLSNYHNSGDKIGYHEGVLGSQGGQGGLIVSYNIPNRHDTIKTHSIGFAQNSYGDLIGAITIGRVINVWKVRLGWEAGFTFGYAKSFQRERERLNIGLNKVTTWVINNRVAPIVTGTIAYDIYKGVGVKVLLNPLYANIGLNYKF